MTKKQVERKPALYITVPLYLCFGHNDKVGHLHMRISDCMANIKQGERPIGSVGGYMGGGYQIQDDLTDNSYHITAQDFWVAYQTAKKRKA